MVASATPVGASHRNLHETSPINSAAFTQRISSKKLDKISNDKGLAVLHQLGQIRSKEQFEEQKQESDEIVTPRIERQNTSKSGITIGGHSSSKF